MNEAAFADRSSVMDGPLQGNEDKAGMGGAADTPANDVTRMNVDDEGDIDKARLCRNIGEVRDPQPVGCGAAQLAIDVIERARRCLVLKRCSQVFAAANTKRQSD